MMARMVGGSTGAVVLLPPRGARRAGAAASCSPSTRRGVRVPFRLSVLLLAMVCPPVSGNVTWYAEPSLRCKGDAYGVRITLRRTDVKGGLVGDTAGGVGEGW